MALGLSLLEDGGKLLFRGGELALDAIRGSNKAKAVAIGVAADTVALPVLADATGLPVAPRLTERIIGAVANSLGRGLGAAGAGVGVGTAAGAQDTLNGQLPKAGPGTPNQTYIILGGILIAVLLMRR